MRNISKDLRPASLLAVLAGLALMAGGCSRGPDLPPMAEVGGLVTLDGKPLPRGMVQFVPEDDQGGKAPPASGNIGSDGRFRLVTGGLSGAVVGRHRVCVQAQQEVDLNKVSWAPSLIPEKYNNPAQSGLTFEVKAGAANDCPLNLSSKP